MQVFIYANSILINIRSTDETGFLLKAKISQIMGKKRKKALHTEHKTLDKVTLTENTSFSHLSNTPSFWTTQSYRNCGIAIYPSFWSLLLAHWSGGILKVQCCWNRISLYSPAAWRLLNFEITKQESYWRLNMQVDWLRKSSTKSCQNPS